MIKVTRLDGQEMFLNPDLIETIEETPDTHVALVNGHRYLLLEPARVVVDRIVAFRARILDRARPATGKRHLDRGRLELYRPFCKLDE